MRPGGSAGGCREGERWTRTAQPPRTPPTPARWPQPDALTRRVCPPRAVSCTSTSICTFSPAEAGLGDIHHSVLRVRHTRIRVTATPCALVGRRAIALSPMHDFIAYLSLFSEMRSAPCEMCLRVTAHTYGRYASAPVSPAHAWTRNRTGTHVGWRLVRTNRSKRNGCVEQACPASGHAP